MTTRRKEKEKEENATEGEQLLSISNTLVVRL
jgi:hypothetical protein